MAWYAMALIDMLDYLPESHTGYQELRTLLQKIAVGIRNTQDPATGLWYQVMDKGDYKGNWIETSGSGMFIYALARAFRKVTSTKAMTAAMVGRAPTEDRLNPTVR